MKIADTTAIVVAIVLKNTIKAQKLGVVETVDTKKNQKNQQILKIYLMEHKLWQK